MSARELVVIGWNVRRPGKSYGRTAAAIEDALHALADEHQPDVFLLSEVAQVHDQLRAFAEAAGFALIVFPRSRDRGDNAILVRAGIPHGPGWSDEPEDPGYFTAGGVRTFGRGQVTTLVGGWLRVVIGHRPPAVNWRRGKMLGPLRRLRTYAAENVDLLRLARLNKRRDRGAGFLAFLDWNEGAGSWGTNSPRWVARIGGLRIAKGHGIDFALYRGCFVTTRVLPKAGSDHPPILHVVRRG